MLLGLIHMEGQGPCRPERPSRILVLLLPSPRLGRITLNLVGFYCLFDVWSDVVGYLRCFRGGRVRSSTDWGPFAYRSD